MMRIARTIPSEAEVLERRDRVDDLFCGHNGTGVVWDIDVENGVHPRVILTPLPSSAAELLCDYKEPAANQPIKGEDYR